MTERYTDISPEAEAARLTALIERIARDGLRQGEAVPQEILNKATSLRLKAT